MKSVKIILFISLLLVNFFPVRAKDKFHNEFEWSAVSPVPAVSGHKIQPGLAGAFAGNIDGNIILAGGANFPNVPALDGGKKVIHDDIFVLPKNEKEWICAGKLPYPVAYGASVSTSQGLYIIGGQVNGEASDKVLLVSWNESTSKIEIKEQKALPFPLKNASATISGNAIYLIGGHSFGGDSEGHFLKLEYSVQSSNWEVLPSFPGKDRAGAIAMAQSGKEKPCIFLFGGISTSGEPYVHTEALKYNTFTKQWSNIGNVYIEEDGVDKLISLQGASAICSGHNHILFFGGVNYDIFTEGLSKECYNNANKKALAELLKKNAQGKASSEDLESIEKLTSDIEEYNTWYKNYLSQPREWFNFNKKVIVFNSVMETWTVGDPVPLPTAGASIVSYKDGWMLINGELKPGVRTPKVFFGHLLNNSSFGWINWSVLITYLLIMLGMGFFFMKRSKSTDDFFKGGGRIPWWAAAISIFATMLSAITFMSIPAKSFSTNWLYFPMAFTILLMAFPVVKFYLPFFRRLNVTTAYEYLEKRFNYKLRLLSSILFIIFMLARLALSLYLTALALTSVTGIEISFCIMLMGIVTLIYCTMGGTEAVVWSDVVQGVILVGGALFVAVYLVFSIDGGVTEFINISLDAEKFKMFDFSLDFTSATFWVIILGGFANNLISYTSDQAVIQRYLATSSEKSAGKSIITNGLLSLGVSVIFYFIGTALYSFYKLSPEALNFALPNSDSIFPHFIMAELPVGMAGLLISAIFAATMSTVASNVNSLSTAFTVDIYRHFARKHSDKRELFVARITGLIFGGFGVVVAIIMAYSNIVSLLDFFNTLLGLITGSVAALFIIGIFLPKIGARSTLLGFILGNILLYMISIYSPVSFLLYGFIGIVLTVGFSFLFSLFIKNDKDVTGFTWKTIKAN